MDWMLWLAAAVIGVVEGFTEYLPVSSTGHIILTQRWLEQGLGRELLFHESFEVVIQSGAVLAVLVEYWRRFMRLTDLRATTGFAGINGWFWLVLTTLPAAVFGLMFHSAIKERLFNPATIAVALFTGGILMIVLERVLPSHDEGGVDEIGWKRALGIGFIQCLAMVPGTSRSMTTILGGRLMGLGRRTAAEYSFFAAVPVLILAGIYDLAKGLGSLQRAHLVPYAIALILSYFVARISIRFLMRILCHHTLEGFGWYRIALSLVVWWTLVR